jgi:hypothetical protein
LDHRDGTIMIMMNKEMEDDVDDDDVDDDDDLSDDSISLVRTLACWAQT